MGCTPPGETRQKILRFVQERLLAGRPPTVREVQAAFRFRAVQTAREHLEALVSAGQLAKEGGRARGYRLPAAAGAGAPPVLVPILGRIQAGALSTAVEDLEGYVAVEPRGSGVDELFGLRVRGESMRDAGILPGDIVVVRRQPTADSGDIVVALVGEEATVKRLRIHRRRLELHPENPDFAAIVPAREEVQILGKVIELRRYLDRA
ncbi:MAG: repressor LexA [Planctomycetes bacterium]|nr:repressor LexA [Planctomycetota bacterium]